MRVYRSPATGKPVSSAGWPYAIFWTLVIGARAAFSYGAAHWFTSSIVAWAIANQVSEAAITDGLIFMAIVMVIVRTAGLAARASRLPDAAPALAGNRASRAHRQVARPPRGAPASARRPQASPGTARIRPSTARHGPRSPEGGRGPRRDHDGALLGARRRQPAACQAW